MNVNTVVKEEFIPLNENVLNECRNINYEINSANDNLLDLKGVKIKSDSSCDESDEDEENYFDEDVLGAQESSFGTKDLLGAKELLGTNDNYLNTEENSFDTEENYTENDLKTEANTVDISALDSNSQEKVSPLSGKKKKRKLDTNEDASNKKQKTRKKKTNSTPEDPLDVGKMTSQKTVKNRSTKNFQQDWFDEFPSWKDWVVRLTNDSKYYCKICDKTMLCGKKEIKNHESSLKHQKKKEITEKLIRYGYVLNNVVNVPVLFSSSNSNTSKPEIENAEAKAPTFKQKVKDAEAKITRFFLENNIPFMLSQKFLELFREIEPLVLKDVKLSSSKMSLLAKEICALETGQEKIVFPKTRKKPIAKVQKKV